MIAATKLSKVYQTPTGTLPVLEDVSLTIEMGDAISIMGPSGSGKSTLLHILGLLDTASSGTLVFDGERPLEMGEAAQARFRNRRIGFVFQDHCLLPQCTVLENVLVPTLVGDNDPEAPARAEELLHRVGLSERIRHRPAQLSGGEKQRVAIARALIRRPALLLCDEPTGNLDEATAASVIDLLFQLQMTPRPMLVAVTHNEALAARFPRRYRVAQRRLEAL